MQSLTKFENVTANKNIVFWEARLRPYQARPRLRVQNHLWCEACDTPMWLVSIEPDVVNHDRRTFECPRCQELAVVVVDISPETA
jgi:hypothetical protein